MILVVMNPPANVGDIRYMGSILGWEDPLEKVMAAHSSINAVGITESLSHTSVTDISLLIN